MDYSGASQKAAQQAAKPKHYNLDPEAKQKLGPVTPELAWEEVKTQVQNAIQNQYKESEALRLKANYPVDLRNLTEVLELIHPVRGVNNLHYANPSLNLQSLPKQPPLSILQAVLNMLTSSDRWAAGKP